MYVSITLDTISCNSRVRLTPKLELHQNTTSNEQMRWRLSAECETETAAVFFISDRFRFCAEMQVRKKTTAAPFWASLSVIGGGGGGEFCAWSARLLIWATQNNAETSMSIGMVKANTMMRFVKHHHPPQPPRPSHRLHKGHLISYSYIYKRHSSHLNELYIVLYYMQYNRIYIAARGVCLVRMKRASWKQHCVENNMRASLFLS